MYQTRSLRSATCKVLSGASGPACALRGLREQGQRHWKAKPYPLRIRREICVEWAACPTARTGTARGPGRAYPWVSENPRCGPISVSWVSDWRRGTAVSASAATCPCAGGRRLGMSKLAAFAGESGVHFPMLRLARRSLPIRTRFKASTCNPTIKHMRRICRWRPSRRTNLS